MEKKSRMERLHSQSRYRLKVSQTLCSASRAAKPLIAHFWDLPQRSTWRASVVWWPCPVSRQASSSARTASSSTWTSSPTSCWRPGKVMVNVHGKQVTQSDSTFTIALRKLAEGWRITAWAWTKGPQK